MLIRGISRSTICLGCRLRLLSQATRPRHAPVIGTRPVALRAPTKRWLASDTLARNTEPDPSAREDRPSPAEAEESKQSEREQNFFVEGNPFTDRDAEIHEAKDRRRRHSRDVYFRSTSKVHLSGKKVLRETSERLGTDMLGKPAYAIVMKERGRINNDKKKKKKRESFGGPSKVTELKDMFNVEALLGKYQLDPPSQSEVRDNINELRPKSEFYLSEKEFRRLQHELEEGFLKSQLIHYLDTFKSGGADGDLADTSSWDNPQEQMRRFMGRFPWIKSYEPWTPLDSSASAIAINDDPNRHLRGYLRSDAPAKTRLAVRILRECWRLQIEELSTGLGEITINLHSREFMLLMRGYRRFLRVISDTYLQPGETIEGFNKKRVIRIVAPRPKAQTVIEEIDNTLRRTRDRTFPASYVTSDITKISQSLLDEVGQMVNANVRLSEKSEGINVTWLEIRRGQSHGIEDMSHIVLRLLRASLQPNHDSRQLHAVLPSSVDETRGEYLVDHWNREKRSWNDKLGQWARYALPISARETGQPHQLGQPDTESVSAPPIQPPLELGFPIEKPQLAFSTPLESPRDDSSFDDSHVHVPPMNWSPDCTTTTTTVFGHVLHEISPSVALPSLTELFKSPDRPSILSPVIMHPMRLAQLNQDPNSVVPITSTILVRLVPHPANLAAFRLPAIELRIALREALFEQRFPPEVVGVHSLRAVTDAQCHDVLQPSHPVDMRITQTRGYDLQGSENQSTLADWPPIRELMSRARIDLAEGKTEMPPRQRFPIPNRLFAQSGVDETSASTQKQKKRKKHSRELNQEELLRAEAEALAEEVVMHRTDPAHVHDVQYIFAGLEMHRTTSVPHPTDPRLQVTYTSIEAGRSGGRRSELSLGVRAPTSPASFTLSTTSEATATDNSESGDQTPEEQSDETTVKKDSTPQNAVQELGPVSQEEFLRASYDLARNPEYWAPYYRSKAEARATKA